MAKQESESSSSQESDSDTTCSSDKVENMETSAEENIQPSLSYLAPDSSKTFSFAIFCKKDHISRQKLFDAYLQSSSSFTKERKSFLMDKTVEMVGSDFTPWWDSWKGGEKHLGNTSRNEGKEPADQPVFNNWFKKSCQGTEASWLCGPKPAPSQGKDTSAVEDIEVPSIYCNVSHAKGRRALKRERKEQRNKTTGKKWFDMKLPDVDSNTKMDMELLQMRRALDPKRFYKQNDRRGLPKYFQMGTVVDEGTDFYSSRLTKKQRKQTLVEELMADVNVRKYNKKKYGELQQKQRTKKFSKKKKS